MNSGVKKTGGRIALECLLAVLTALITPFAVLFELLSVRLVLMLPAIGYVFLKNYAGRKMANLSGLLMLIFSALLLDISFVLVLFAMNILPQMVMRATEKASFGTRMQASVIAFLLGAALSVLVMYLFYGGNMIEQYLGKLPEMLRTIPEEQISGSLNAVSGILGEEITPERFYRIFDESVQNLIPLYQLNMPGMLLGGALISAVFCVWLDGLLATGGKEGAAVAYLPVHKWFLPASTTGGLLLIFGVSLVLYLANARYGQTVFATVFQLAVAAFSIQGFASVRRKMHSRPGRAFGIVMSLVYLTLALIGAAPYLALYGVGSAVLGSGGVLKQRMDEKMGRFDEIRKDKHHKDDRDDDSK